MTFFLVLVTIGKTTVQFFRSPLEKKTDEEIVKEIVETNQHQLFGLLYDRYSDKVYHKCISFAKNRDDAQDMLHDVFLKTFSKLSTFTGKSSFSTWLYSITYNFCVDYARKKSNRTTRSLDEVSEISEMEDQKNEQALLGIKAETLKRLLDEINPGDKAILLMKFQDDASIKEIAEMLDLGESAVKMRIKRAKASALKEFKRIHQELDR